MSPPERAAGKGSSARHNPLKRNQDKSKFEGSCLRFGPSDLIIIRRTRTHASNMNFINPHHSWLLRVGLGLHL